MLPSLAEMLQRLALAGEPLALGLSSLVLSLLQLLALLHWLAPCLTSLSEPLLS